MSLCDDFLKQSRYLAMGSKHPTQINLRRAISAAYYAVFHLLIQEAVKAAVPANPSDLRARAARSFQHGEMREVCKLFQAQGAPSKLASLFSAPPSPELRSIADIFVKLQAERHAADYDSMLKLSQSQVLLSVANAEGAFLHWRKIRKETEASVFLAALVFGKRWDR